MKSNIQSVILTILFVISSFNICAHNPQISSLRLNIQNNTGILEFSLAQHGIEQALLKKYPDINLKVITPNSFKELLVKYLKETVLLSANGKPIKLGTGIVKLGSHQSDLKFKLKNIPKIINYIDVNAYCFQENENQQNFFTLTKEHLKSKIKLSRENNFYSRFEILKAEISVTDNFNKKTYPNTNFVWYALLLSIIVVISIFIVKATGLKLQ